MSSKKSDSSDLESPQAVEVLTSDLPDIDERRLYRKLDWRLLPIVSMLYLLSFLDRANIGNAKVAGMATDLHLSGIKYNLCAAVFFIPYCFFEIPSNIAMKLLRPSIWLPFIMVLWGSVMVSMAFVRNFKGLLTARVFLGMTEAGLFPGVTFYLSLWYPRRILAQRVALFISAVTVSGAFGGILAFGIEKMEGIGGLHGWSWIFLLEGLATASVAFLAFFVMHDYPETATFLLPNERAFLLQQLQDDTALLAKHFDWKFLWQALSDPKSYLQVIIYLTAVIPTYAFALFLPTIIAGLGFSNSNAQLLSTPPYVLSCFTTILIGKLSDRSGLRGPYIMGGCLVSIVGFAVLFGTSSPGAGYAGAMIAAAGLFPNIACILVWAGGNAGGDIKRGVVIAMVIGIGNLGGIASSFIYRSQDSPRFHLGHAFCLGCLCIAFVTSLAAMFIYARLNKNKQAQATSIDDEKNQHDYSDMGDKSPLFRYAL